LGNKLCYKLLIVFILCLATKAGLAANDANNPQIGIRQTTGGSFIDSLKTFDDWPRQKKAAALNIVAAGTVLVVGTASWGYGTASFHCEDEGWFDPDTPYGGADKLGHLYSGYVLTDIYSGIYKKFGYSDQDAANWGALSSWSQMTLIEICDGFSDEYGFCWQDEAMNSAGMALGYLRHCYPSLKDKFDYRLEWNPSPAYRHGARVTPFTDYSGQKYLIALKPDGFLKTDEPLLKMVEFQVGYYSRGYDEEKYFRGNNRYGYYGIGINITELLKQLTGWNAWGIFNYVQVPFTYIASSTRLD
jgi:hypothetical protein